MLVNRGDVILAYVPNVGSPGGKVRPAGLRFLVPALTGWKR